MKGLIIFFFIITTINYIPAQNSYVDSLLSEIEHLEDDTQKVNTWIRLAKYDRHAVEVKEYSLQALKFSEKLNYDIGKANSLYYLSYYYYYKGDFEKVIELRGKTLKSFNEIDDSIAYAHISNIAGISYFSTGDAASALSTIDQGLEYIDGQKYSELRNQLNINKSRMLIEIGEMQKATELLYETIKYDLNNNRIEDAARSYYNLLRLDKNIDLAEVEKCFLEALNYVKENKHVRDECEFLYFMGVLKYWQHNYIESIEYYKKSERLAIQHNLKYRYAITAHSISFNYIELKDYQTALKYSNIALDNINFLSLNEKTQLYQQIGNLYFLCKEYKKAIQYLKIGVNLSEQMGNIEIQSLITESLYKCYKHVNNYEKALYYYEKHVIYNDSIFNIENNNYISKLRTKYETEKKEQYIKLQKSQLKQNEKK